MQGNQSAAQASIDWRDWIAFLGYVLATAVVVSVMLASVVLVISIQAESPVRNDLAPVVQSPANAALAAPADEARPQVAPQADAAAAVAGGEPAAAQRVEAAPAPVPPIEITSETLRAETPVEPATSPR
jgi:hypothetical protein